MKMKIKWELVLCFIMGGLMGAPVSFMVGRRMLRHHFRDRHQPQSQAGMQKLMEQVFPAEFISAHASEINLSKAQEEKIRSEVKSALGEGVDIEWKLNEEMSKLASAISSAQVDEAKVLPQLDAVLAQDSTVKRKRALTLIHIKNILTPEQQAKLKTLR